MPEPMHTLNQTKEWCTWCTSDTCLCQYCATVVCGSQARWFPTIGNICHPCLAIIKAVPLDERDPFKYPNPEHYASSY